VACYRKACADYPFKLKVKNVSVIGFSYFLSAGYYVILAVDYCAAAEKISMNITLHFFLSPRAYSDKRSARLIFCAGSQPGNSAGPVFDFIFLLK